MATMYGSGQRNRKAIGTSLPPATIAAATETMTAASTSSNAVLVRRKKPNATGGTSRSVAPTNASTRLVRISGLGSVSAQTITIPRPTRKNAPITAPVIARFAGRSKPACAGMPNRREVLHLGLTFPRFIGRGRPRFRPLGGGQPRPEGVRVEEEPDRDRDDRDHHADRHARLQDRARPPAAPVAAQALEPGGPVLLGMAAGQRQVVRVEPRQQHAQ